MKDRNDRKQCNDNLNNILPHQIELHAHSQLKQKTGEDVECLEQHLFGKFCRIKEAHC